LRLRENTVNCSLTSLLRTTAGLTTPANTASCWKVTVTDGTALADLIIFCAEPTSIKRRLAYIEKPPKHQCATAAYLRLPKLYPIPRESSVGWSIAAVVVSPLSPW